MTEDYIKIINENDALVKINEKLKACDKYLMWDDFGYREIVWARNNNILASLYNSTLGLDGSVFTIPANHKFIMNWFGVKEVLFTTFVSFDEICNEKHMNHKKL